eukprot:3401008-Alexandrium_andersonii.AAC.1
MGRCAGHAARRVGWMKWSSLHCMLCSAASALPLRAAPRIALFGAVASVYCHPYVVHTRRPLALFTQG